jgi:ketosteroid isomerase-like protein
MEEQIARARNMVIQYADNVAKKNLDGILEALADDVQVVMSDGSIFEGKDHVGEFYKMSFTEGDFEFNHEFIDGKRVSDLIFISGKLNKYFTAVGKQVESTSFDFSFIFRKEADELKIWQLRVV